MATNIVFKTIFALCIFVLISCESLQKADTPRVANDEEHDLIEITSDVAVNIEGTITEVSKDGKSFRLDNGMWIIIDKHTEMGITGPNAAPKEEQYFEPTFRVGNSIAGFTEYPDGEIILAYAIYTNWNWDNPIKK